MVFEIGERIEYLITGPRTWFQAATKIEAYTFKLSAAVKSMADQGNVDLKAYRNHHTDLSVCLISSTARFQSLKRDPKLIIIRVVIT